MNKLTVPSGTTPALDGRWRKSTRSQANGNCIEVRLVDGTVQVRDSKDVDGPALDVGTVDWVRFARTIAAGDLSSS
jgi:hypothetical protein